MTTRRTLKPFALTSPPSSAPDANPSVPAFSSR
jgi:hypothetical protein